MDVRNIVVMNDNEEKMIIYGLEFILSKTLNRFTDKIQVFNKRYLNGLDKYILIFTKKTNGNILKNEFEISKYCLNKYIIFMKNVYCEGFSKNIVYEFYLKGKGKIEFSFLNENNIKLITCDFEQKKNFFVFTKKELLNYIEYVECTYERKKVQEGMSNYLKKIIEKYQYKLTKKEKDMLYLDSLYILMDEALDSRNKIYFKNISNQINKIKSLY